MQAIENLDSGVAKFAKGVPKGAGAVLTADHGVIDVDKSDHVYLDEFSSMQDVLMIGGDPRAGYLYFDVGTDLLTKRTEISEELSGLVDVSTMKELVESGWLEPLSPTAAKVSPDLVLLPKRNKVVYHRSFAKKKSLEMIGQHGGMSKPEWEVPLLVF
jgi:hypothetical protein